MTIESKRRAVFTVLSDYLRGETLWEAMWRWQNQFADKSQYELNGFLSQCGDIPEVSANRPQLYRQLISQLMVNSSGLKPDPIEQMLQYRQQQEALGVFAADSADWSQAFSSVLEHLFGQLRSDTARQVKRFASEQAVRNGLPQNIAYAFTLWEQGGDPIAVQGAPLVQLKRLLNFVYIGLCEYLGPVDADRILSLSIRSAGADRRHNADPRLLLEK